MANTATNMTDWSRPLGVIGYPQVASETDETATNGLQQQEGSSEQYLYGSSRLGGIKPLVEWTTTLPDTPTYQDSISIGWKYYEAGNHLGNVLSVANDRKEKIDIDGDNEADYFDATILSASDYYPFGDRSRARHPKCLVSEGNEAPTPHPAFSAGKEWMRSQDAHQERSCGQDMPSRTYASADYRYGFNGKEKDPGEEWGDANHYDYGFRIYNPEIAKFLSVDPLMKDYPTWTPYTFAMNRPIDGVDLDGLEWEAFWAAIDQVTKGVGALEVVGTDNGIGVLNKTTYSLTSRSSKNDFERLKQAYITDPGIVHNPNNDYATYYPLESKFDDDNILGVGDHMYIDLLGPINAHVRLSSVDVTENSFAIKALTLRGHPDAGFIIFKGEYNQETGTLDFSIHNETTNNIGLDAATINFGRYAQAKQWKVVLNNVEQYVSGEVLKKSYEKEISIQNPSPGDGARYITEDLLTGERTEELKENSTTNGGG